MKISIPRFASDEFKLAIAEVVCNQRDSLSEKFVVDQVWAIADDGQEFPMPVRFEGSRLIWTLDASEITPTIFVKLKVRFRDGTCEDAEIEALRIGGLIPLFTVTMKF
jgi:hypothetical protein